MPTNQPVLGGVNGHLPMLTMDRMRRLRRPGNVGNLCLYWTVSRNVLQVSLSACFCSAHCPERWIGACANNEFSASLRIDKDR